MAADAKGNVYGSLTGGMALKKFARKVAGLGSRPRLTKSARGNMGSKARFVSCCVFSAP